MAVAEYVTKDDLEEALNPIKTEMEAMEKRIIEACATHSREQANRVIDAISHGTNPSY